MILKETKNKKRILCILGCVLLLILIFMFSSRPDTGYRRDRWKTYDDGMVAGFLFIPGFDSLDWEKRLDMSRELNHPAQLVVTSALYFGIGYLAYAGIYNKKLFKNVYAFLVLLAMVILLLAELDEIHQYYVYGQTSFWIDGVVEMCVAYFGGLCSYLYDKWVGKSVLEEASEG